MVPPETRYATSGDVSIAYQVLGDGPIDLVAIPGLVSHLDYAWEEPGLARYYQRLAGFARLIILDKRGTGMSDRAAGVPILEQRMDDVRAVMDAEACRRAAIYGVSEGGAMAILFAATYPERTAALVLYGTHARFCWAPDCPWRPRQPSEEEFRRIAQETRARWGTLDPVSIAEFAPTAAADARFVRWWASYLRLSASPGAFLDLLRMNWELDVRHVLPTIGVPTLILQRAGDRAVPVQDGRYLADRIPGARYVELPGDDHLAWVGDPGALLAEIEEFLTGVRPEAEPDRVLATMLFTDIVGSTERATELGDRRWRDLLGGHHAAVRRELGRFRGREVRDTGDGVFAAFDGPARAIRCACAIRDAVRPLGLAIRAGLHTGECEVVGDALQGVAVHVAARVAAFAAADEVVVSSTVRDLVAGSGIRFDDRGSHALKGLDDAWRLFAVAA